MKAVKKFNYLFLRKQTYYFRFNFSTEILGCDIRLSLKTENLVYALQCIESLEPSIKELKRLGMASKSLCLPILKQKVALVKGNMKNQLTLSNIDCVLAETEKNTSNNMHLMNVLGDVSIADLPDETLKQLADVLTTEDHKQMQQKVSSYAATPWEGDYLVITKLDRLARSLTDLHKIVEEIEVKGAALQVLGQSIDTSRTTGKLMFSMLGAFAEFERDLINERVREGIAKAKANGTKFGKPRVIEAEKRRRIVELMDDEYSNLTKQEIATMMGVLEISYIVYIEKASYKNGDNSPRFLK